jgi:hypothetical protein
MTFVPIRPAMLPLLVFKDIPNALAELVGLPKMRAGVGVYGEASAYALVWELGSRRMKRPGPKTTWSVNRNQEKAILTMQSPFGYVTPTSGFDEIIQDEIAKIDFGKPASPREMTMLLELALDNAAQQIAKIIARRAPVDSGALRSEILGVDTDESDFLDMGEDADVEASGTLIM